MLIYKSSINSAPGRFYRSTSAIREDIRKISERIADVNEMLNIREIISGYLCSEKLDVSDAVSLGELLEFAKEALEEFIELNEMLDELKRELLSAVSVVG